MDKKPLVLAVSLALTVLATHPAQAVAATWIGTDGWWNDGFNWDTGVQPQNGDYALLIQSDAINRTVSYSNTAYPNAVLGGGGRGVEIDAYGSGTMTLLQTKDALSVSGNVIIGEMGSGTYNLSGTGGLSATGVVVGVEGTGIFNQSGGTHTVGKSLTLGSFSGSGTYNLSAGSLAANNMTVGQYGTGIFNQSGGTNTVSGTLSLGSYSGSSGTYNLDGGTLKVGSIARGAGDGSFNWTGGTLNYSGNFIVGNSGLFGQTFNLDGSKTLSAANLTVDTNATFTQISGTHSISNLMAIGGTTNLNGGTLNVSSTGGSGTLNLNGGVLSVGGGNGTIDVGTLVLGQASGSNVSYTLVTTGFYNGATKVASALTVNNLTLGDSGYGTLNQSGGTNTVSGTLSLGSNSGSSGTYNLDGGTLNVGSIGGSGTLNLNGGVLSVGGGHGNINVGNLVLGQVSGSNVSYTLSTMGFYNGATKVASALTVGNMTLGDSGTSTFNMVGGSIYGAATLTQNASSKLTGFGIIYADDISNAGTINAKSGNLVLNGNSFSNTGLIKNSVGSNLFIEAATINHQGSIEVNSAGSIVFDAAITNATGKNVALLGGTLATPVLTNQAGGNIKGFGTLTGDLVNAGMVEFYGPTNIIGELTNESGGTLLVKNDQTLITGHTVNNGTIKTLQGKVIFEGGLTNNGAYLSDPSENYFTDLVVNQSGYLVGELGDKFLISGDFENYSLQDTLWNTSAANLTLSGVSLQNMYLAGDDLGALTSGYANNFAWGELSLVAGSSLKMWDGNGDPGAALYVGLVELGGGLGQLSSIDSTYNIYYDANLTGNAYLGGQSYALNGGGYLMAAQPVPEAETYAMMLAGLGLVGFMARRRKQAAI